MYSPYEQLLAGLVLVEHDREGPAVPRHAAFLDQREEVILLLLVVAAVDVLDEVAQQIADHLRVRRSGGKCLLAGVEDLLRGLVVPHQQLFPFGHVHLPGSRHSRTPETRIDLGQVGPGKSGRRVPLRGSYAPGRE
jgi:hypothetical protein